MLIYTFTQIFEHETSIAIFTTTFANSRPKTRTPQRFRLLFGTKNKKEFIMHGL